MKIGEFDWRLPWTRNALAALDAGLESLTRELDDGIDIQEHADAIAGLGFVALQAYASGVIADLRAVFGPVVPSQAECLQRNAVIVRSSKLSALEGIWAAANYYKHHDMWSDDWREAHAPTRAALAHLGIGPSTDWPCWVLFERLNMHSLAKLLSVTAAWRDRWFEELRSVQPN